MPFMGPDLEINSILFYSILFCKKTLAYHGIGTLQQLKVTGIFSSPRGLIFANKYILLYSTAVYMYM